MLSSRGNFPSTWGWNSESLCLLQWPGWLFTWRHLGKPGCRRGYHKLMEFLGNFLLTFFLYHSLFHEGSSKRV